MGTQNNSNPKTNLIIRMEEKLTKLKAIRLCNDQRQITSRAYLKEHMNVEDSSDIHAEDNKILK